MNTLKRFIPLFGLLALLGAGPATQPVPAVTINRRDFTIAELRFEDAYLAHPPDDDNARARIHRAFDEAFSLYFNAKKPEAIQALNELTDRIAPAAKDPAMAALIHSLQVRIAPAVALRSRPGIMRIRIARMYPTDIPLPVDLHLIIRADAPQSDALLDVPVRIEAQGPPFSIARGGPSVAMGKHLVELVTSTGEHYPIDSWPVVEAPLNVVRNGNQRRLGEFVPDSVDMRQALAACLSRNVLLNDQPDDNNSARYLADTLELSRQVQSESESIAMGRNPYGERVGDWWRAILAGQMQIPARVYAPAQVRQHKPLPLVIALQGGGEDESYFFESAGRGRIKKLADQYGFVIAAPNAVWLNNNLAGLDGIISAMSSIYAIDLARIYIIGHAWGANVAIQLAARNPEKIAAIALFSGGDFGGAKKLPRVRVYCGQANPIFAPNQARAAVQQAQAANLPVELRSIDFAGHILIVNDQLEDAIQWLLQ
ncbi:MAG TPA: hypothetical protein VHD56_15245 [Tepidisphaeraceae bacterium]|nr:hypothetical protein [Tepidisphaeraceae bacterium]